jgi:H+/gluconate symporter-like permease
LRADAWPLVGAWCVALLSASLCFAISNGSFYWLGGRYANPHMAEYLQRLWQWGPLFVRTTMAYVTTALVAYFVGSRIVAWYGVHHSSAARP